MIAIKVIFQDGNSLKTMINATLKEAKKYYLGRYFNLGCEGDDMQKAIRVETI